MDKLIIFLLIICGAFVLTILILVQNEDVSYEEFSTSFRNGNQNLKSRSILNGCLLIFGIVFACLFFALSKVLNQHLLAK